MKKKLKDVTLENIRLLNVRYSTTINEIDCIFEITVDVKKRHLNALKRKDCKGLGTGIFDIKATLDKHQEG